MCGRFVYFGQPGLLLERLEVSGDPPRFEPTYNIAPGYLTPVITRGSSSDLSLMKWGLIPSWAKDPRIGYKMINARAEGIDSKPAFRKPVRSQRCLVLANGFYEWQQSEQGGKKSKIPHFIHLADREAFAFAGVYDVWRDAEGRVTRSYAIITTTPNDLMAPIHNRMPAILTEDCHEAWLDPTTRLEQVLAMLRPYPLGDMEAYPVSDLVNTPRNNSPELIARQVPV